MTDAALGPLVVENVILNPADALRTDCVCYFGSNLPADLYYSLDNVSFTRVATATVPQATGVARTLLPRVNKPHAPDLFSTLDVDMIFGAPATCSKADFLAGANQALVGIAGRWELVYFRNVTALTGSKVRLSTFLRGRKNTGPMIASHAVNDTVIFGPFDGMVRFTRPASEIGTVGNLRAVGQGEAPTASARFAGRFTTTGATLRPWPPCSFLAQRSGSDIVFSWVRRDRAPSVLHDSDGIVPMSETSELYTFEAWAYPDDTTRTLVKRVTGLTLPTYTLLAADIAAAGATTLDRFVVRVTQDNAHGRGWPHVGNVYVKP